MDGLEDIRRYRTLSSGQAWEESLARWANDLLTVGACHSMPKPGHGISHGMPWHIAWLATAYAMACVMACHGILHAMP